MSEHAISRRFFLGLGAVASGVRPSIALADSGLVPQEESIDVQSQSKEKKNVSVFCPILYWHDVSSRAAFQSQIEMIVKRGYQPINLESLLKLMNGEEIPLEEGKKPIVLTFDDTLLSQKENVWPVLEEKKLPGVFAVMPDWKGDGVYHRYMQAGEDGDIAKIVKKGWDVISHTFFHHGKGLPDERVTNNGSWQADIVEAKKRLETIIGDGYQVKGFAYPSGMYDPQTVELVGRNYAIAFSTDWGTMQTNQGIGMFVLKRLSADNPKTWEII